MLGLLDRQLGWGLLKVQIFCAWCINVFPFYCWKQGPGHGELSTVPFSVITDLKNPHPAASFPAYTQNFSLLRLHNNLNIFVKKLWKITDKTNWSTEQYILEINYERDGPVWNIIGQVFIGIKKPDSDVIHWY